jgi:Anti-sigma factor NepR
MELPERKKVPKPWNQPPERTFNSDDAWGTGRFKCCRPPAEDTMKDAKSTTGPRSEMDVGANPGKADAKLGRDIQAKIGQQLRALYDEVVNQGVPDRFTELLNRLDKPDDKEVR